MSAAELARRIKVPVNRITEILNGRRAVTGDTALRLGRFFGTSGAFRLADLPDWFRVRGYSDELARGKTLQGTAMHHRGVQAGNFFLAGKEDAPEFSAADEEMLGPFASLTAAAIGNAQAHQQEQRTRADLEALIETTPVGVMFVDARTGRPVSSSRFCSGFRPAPHLPR